MLVHPHGRGELYVCVCLPSVGDGSSPRTWGTHVTYPEICYLHRFIPTDVGNSTGHVSNFAQRMVHPHGRGELLFPPFIHIDKYGSSPRTWGTRYVDTIDFCSFTVHPHGRGELRPCRNHQHLYTGSSPRTWGTLERDACRPRRTGFIPTDVGNSLL